MTEADLHTLVGRHIQGAMQIAASRLRSADDLAAQAEYTRALIMSAARQFADEVAELAWIAAKNYAPPAA